jgi:hypothetical protein
MPLLAQHLPLGWAALAIGVHASTASRWRRREKRGVPLTRKRGRRPPPLSVTACSEATQVVQETCGLIGAEALRHRVAGLTRRLAADIKRDTCRVIERERRRDAERLTVATPGIVRGFDALEICGAGERRRHALIAADGCVPFRTSWTIAARYDGGAVADILRRDFDTFGPPLVLRLDRASCHDVPAVHDLLDAHCVLALHGPSHYPRYYGQLERQNREHREWMAASPRPLDLDRMMSTLNQRPRGTLGWRSADELWRARPGIEMDRQALADDVNDRAARIRRSLNVAPASQDLAWRLAVKQALVDRRLLRIEKGGWC